MSPRTRCLTSIFVSLPGRTGPATTSPGSSAGTIDRVAATLARVTPARGKRTVCRRSGGAAEVARMAARGGVIGVGAEHPHELGNDVALAELHDRGAGRLGAGVLDDREVTRAERGDLGQVGDAKPLPALPQLTQPRSNGARGLTADARIDLIEDKRGVGLRGARDAHDREHHPRELSAGGD